MIDSKKLATERLELLPLSLADTEGLFQIAKNPASIEDFHYSLKTVEEMIEWVKKYLDSKVPSWTIRAEKSLIGFIETKIQNEGIVKIGYFVDKDFQGKGYATEALEAVIIWLFTETSVHRIEARVPAHNTASQRVMEKLKFKLEGISRQNWFWKGKWYDSANYALLKKRK